MPPVLIAAGIGGLGPGAVGDCAQRCRAFFSGLGSPTVTSEFGLVNGAAFIVTSIGVVVGR